MNSLNITNGSSFEQNSFASNNFNNELKKTLNTNTTIESYDSNKENSPPSSEKEEDI